MSKKSSQNFFDKLRQSREALPVLLSYCAHRFVQRLEEESGKLRGKIGVNLRESPLPATSGSMQRFFAGITRHAASEAASLGRSI